MSNDDTPRQSSLYDVIEGVLSLVLVYLAVYATIRDLALHHTWWAALDVVFALVMFHGYVLAGKKVRDR